MTTALLSVSDKTNLVPFAQSLIELGFRLISTGGTARHLSQHHIPVLQVSDHTGAQEILNGRVKTLHPTIHGGILARREVDEDMQTLKNHHIDPIDLVVVNLYPFEQTINAQDVTWPVAIENIDIGGPTMVRAAAKNHRDVAVVVDPQDYDAIIDALTHKQLDQTMRRRLASKAFAHTARYDAIIASYFEAQLDDPLPPRLNLQTTTGLRYGENPHQRAALYHQRDAQPMGGFEQLHGKALSYNNLVDADAALALVEEFDAPSVSIIKHTNPAGCASAQTLEQAYIDALACDAKSAFGGIVACNRPINATLAQRMHEHFFEVILAPAFEAEALSILQQKKHIRLLTIPNILHSPTQTLKHTYFGVLQQSIDAPIDGWSEDWEVVTGSMDEALKQDLLFQWRVCKHVKSNAIVMGQGTRTVGVGAGQMSRVDAVELAIKKANSSLDGAVMASDAFFPFRDAVDVAAQAGVRAIIQPGGSRRDGEVIEACQAHGITMVMTGRRHFRHG